MKFSVAVLTVAVAAAMFSPASALPAAAAPPPGPMLQHQLRPITPGMFERRGDQAFFNHRPGFRHRVPGYRFYNGYWFPPEAFVGLFLGTVIGNALSNANASEDSHMRWCREHYRSYRLSDDTFQPYHGPRQICVSPFD